MSRRRIIKSKRSTALRILLLLAALALIIWGAIALIRGGAGKKSAGALTALPFGEGVEFAYNDTGFLYVSGDKLRYSDIADARNDYSVSLSAENVKLSASASIAVLYNEGALQILGAEFSDAFSGTVLAVRCGGSHAAVLKRDAAGSTSLLVYASDGTLADEIAFPSVTLVDFGFASSSSDVLWTISVDDDGSVPVETITTYDMAKAATTGVMTVQSQLVDKLYFTDSSMFACCTNSLIRYNPVNNTEVYRVLVYGYRPLDFSGPNALFLLTPRGDGELISCKLCSVSENDVAAETIAELQLPEGSLHACLCGDRLLVFTQESVYVYSSAGKLTDTLALELNIDSARKLSDSHVLVASGGAYYLYTVK